MNEKIENEVKKSKKDKSSDAAEVKEMLGVVSTEIPDLIKNIFQSIYDPSIAGNYAKGIGSLYQELKDQGLPEDMIREIVLNFSKSFDLLGNAMKTMPQEIEKEFGKKKKSEED
ncbi:MAG: hypothetical protein HGN29_06100 [Asgard group archaeon]|nr:hypothetical protein [Asgard group archaeon]